MRFPIHIATDMMSWQLRNWRRGNARYPCVLLLGPLQPCTRAWPWCSPERSSGCPKDALGHVRGTRGGRGVEGIVTGRGDRWAAVGEARFLHRDEPRRQFQRVLELSKRYPSSSTPLFLQFAAGQRDSPCTPWGTPTRTPKGWK